MKPKQTGGNNPLLLLILFAVVIGLAAPQLIHGGTSASTDAFKRVDGPAKNAAKSDDKKSAKSAPEAKETGDAEPPPKPLPQPLSDRVTEYHIDVSLDEAAKTLNGSETLTWKNPGKKPVSTLYLHLYPNAFESKDTAFMKESGGKLREDQMKEGSYGSVTLAKLTTEDGGDLLAGLRYVQPDDGEPKGDRTLAEIPLPEPVDPGANVTLRIGFTVKLPAVFARMGYKDDFVMAGQWFPKVAVYEPAGVRGRREEGWNLHAYHGNSEFYSDFGIYSVRIRVPKDYIVAASGFPTGAPVTKGDEKTYRFYADDVHDFAWAASPHFVYAEEAYSTPNIPGLKIKLYLDPLHQNLKDRYFAAAKKALTDYSDWYGKYPYATLSIVVPPIGANGAGGMEYPTLITAWSAEKSDPDLSLERVVVHEIGHQYWYGMVATNEFEEAWLDEGFTSYAEDRVMEKEYGQTSSRPIESSYMTAPEPLKHNAWDYGGHDRYADNVYIRAKLVLEDIERKIGQKQMDRVLRTYFAKWKFRHPSTADFQGVLEQVTGRSWKDYFNQFVYGGSMIDYAVDQISVRPIRGDNGASYENMVRIVRHGGYDSDSKVPIVFHFADGSRTVKFWSGQEASVQYKIASKAPLSWAAIDPNFSIILENRHMNNFMRAEVDGKWHVRWTLGTLKAIETLVGSLIW